MRPFTLILLALVLIPPAASAKAPFVAELPMAEKWEKPQSAVFFPTVIRSAHDAEMIVRFDVVSQEGELLVVTPVPIRLAPGQHAQVPLTVQTPYRNGFMNETGTVLYRLTAADATSGATLGAQELSVVVHTKGMYVPAAQFFGVMAALAVAAALIRRR